MLYLAFIHFYVSSRTFLVKLSGIKKSVDIYTGFVSDTVLKDISTEYFIQMNKARVCRTLIFLMVVYECSSHYFDFFCSTQFHMLMQKVL